MYPHLHALVGAQVDLSILVYTSGVAGLDSRERKLEALLVELSGLRRTRILDSVHTRGKNIVHGFASGVLFDVHYRHVEFTLGRRIVAAVEVELIVAPFASHKLKGGEAQVGHLLEAGHEHAGEPDSREVLDAAHNLVGGAQRNLELIPYCRLLTFGSVDFGNLLVGDIVPANFQIFRTKRNLILEIAFVFVERVVLIDVFHIRNGTRRLIARIGGIFRSKRVPFDSVISFISVENTGAVLIIPVAAVEMIVIARRVVHGREGILLHLGYCGCRKFPPQLVEISFIR